MASAVASAARALTIARLIAIGAAAVGLLVYRPAGYAVILLVLLLSFVVFPYTLTAILRSRMRKRKHG